MNVVKRTLLCLFFMFSFWTVTSTIYASESGRPITITLTSYFDEYNHPSTIINNVYYGDKVSLADRLTNNPDYQFSFWIVDGVVRYDYKINHEFILTDNMDIKAIFKPIGTYAVVFMATNGKLLDVQYVEPGGNAVEPNDVNYPIIPGYVLKGNKWDKPLTNINKDTVITLQYEKETREDYLLVVNEGYIEETGKISDYIPFNKTVTVVSNPAPEGKQFSYWMNGDYIVSYKSSYTFTVLTDTTLVAIYKDTDTVETPLVNISDELGIISGKKVYAGQFYLPENHTLVEYGILTSTNNGVIDLDTPGVKRNKGLTYYPITNEWLMSFSDTNIISVRAYLIYKDSDGDLHTIYNEKIESVPGTGEEVTILTATATQIPAGSLINNGWAQQGIEQSTSDNSWAFETANEWLRTPLLNTTTGKITLEISAKATGSIQDNTFSIYGLDNNQNIVETIGPIMVGTNGAKIIGSSFKKLSYEFENHTNNIKYIKIIYHKETSGTNLRINEITITQQTPTKTIDRITASLGKSEYYLDQSLDLTGSSLIVYYSDGTYNSVNLTTEMISGFSTNVISDEYQTATVTYNDYSCDLKYKVHNTPIIIYEVYGGGGNTGAVYTHDYVVLYNNTTSDIDLSGYSLQYASSSSYNYTVLKLSGLIYQNSYYLIRLASGGSIGSALPLEPNIEGTINLSQTSGKIALVKSTVGISSSSDYNVIDFLGYGTNANEAEGTRTGNISSSTSAKRQTYIDSNNNSTDFSISASNLGYLLDPSVNNEIVGISLNKIDTYYKANEELNLTDASIYVHYRNGRKELVEITSEMISGFGTTSKGSYMMVISYEGYNTTVKYTVLDDSYDSEVKIYYIDIGETGGNPGEAALIKIGDIEILIDSGDNDSNTVYELLSFLEGVVYDDVIEYVIATHPDADHIGAMKYVYEAYLIENTILYSTSGTPSGIRQEFEQVVYAEGTDIHYVYSIVTSDNILEIIEGVDLTFYDTGFLTGSNNNASSIIFVLNAFGTRVLFNGDAEANQEAVYAPLVGDVDIFKLGHHGTANGTSTTLLNYIKPEIAIVNNGDYLGNRYSHPTLDALSRIYAYNSNINVYAVTGGNGSGSDIMLDRNGDITVTITHDGYYISSKYYNDMPLEIRYTTYWQSLTGDDFDGYYDGIDPNLTGEALKQALHDLIDDHRSISYDDIKDAFLFTEEDPNNTNNVLLLYTGRSQGKDTFGASGDAYNREHVWAQAHGINERRPAYTDLHHVRATDASVNGLRGNLDFCDVPHTTSNIAGSISEYGQGSSYSYVVSNYCFEPRDEVKGDVARMMFYMAVRYEGDAPNEPDLELVYGLTSSGTSNFGDLETLLLWHQLDPVDDWERARNEKVYQIQYNRNPFIDHPEYVVKIFGGTN